VALRLILPGIVAYSVVAVLSRYIVGRGRPGTGTLILVAGLAVNIVANLILVPRFGINGAAASSSISYGLTAIVTLVVFQRLSGRSIVETLLIRPSDLRAARGLLEAVLRRLRGGRGEEIEVPASETAAEIVLAEREPGEEA
jgi:Na+-driven multidrug efflux pump